MIPIKKYSADFELFYFNSVFDIVCKVSDEYLDEFLTSISNYLPHNYFHDCITNKEKYRKLIIAPYKQLKYLHDYIEKNSMEIMNDLTFQLVEGKEEHPNQEPYIQYVKLYKKVCVKQSDNEQMNIKLVKQSHMLTCPYCNRDYINWRSSHNSGAQLDHFFNKSIYPIFALCLYNLIPVCGNCNRTKSSLNENFVSPFDESKKFDKDITFSYHPQKKNRVQIEGKNGFEVNIEKLKLENVYQIHHIDAQEIEDRILTYCSSQVNEIEMVFNENGYSLGEYRRAIFGKYLLNEHFGSRSLEKFRNDIVNQMIRTHAANLTQESKR